MKRLLGVIALACAAVSVAVPSAHAATRSQRDLPADAPRALYRAEPSLPKAAGWPGSNTAFSRTSGTGRFADGGFYWTDYLYDDHGATTTSTGGLSVTAGSPSFGTYTYPAGKAHNSASHNSASHNNGADIFRAAVLLRSHATYWRVDWTTLASRRVPIAEWTFDRDDKASTGSSTWPAEAGVSSPGIDTALVMSGKGARVIDVATGHVRARLHTTVDRAAHSFVVRMPNRILHPRDTWRIRLAAGLANAAGTGFAPAPDAAPGQTHVYNVTFRTAKQEAPSDNFWNDMAQTQALDAGNVSTFSRLVRWSRLRRHVTTPQPRPSGWSDRWYVSDVNLGNGVLTDSASISDGKPNYLGRIQPYAVFVPTSYRPGRPTPLTFLLHSLTQNHNQYAATTPHFTQQACQARHSICVTTLGRGPDGNYYDTAELDFWQVWHEVAAAYRLNPNRTALSGYSMGGIGTNQLAQGHPDLFARAVTLAGATGDSPSLANLRWVPTYLAGGAEDELVPVPVQRAEADALDTLGDRYRWLVIPAIDHVGYELADSFADAARYLGHSSRVRNPGRFTFIWDPRNHEDTFEERGTKLGGLSWTQEPKLGIGTTGDYWLRDLRARSKGHEAAVVAKSGERPDRSVTAHRSHAVSRNLDPEPSYISTLTWTRGAHAARRAIIRLNLRNVRSLRVLPADAGFHHGQHGVLHLTTDGPVTLHLGSRRISLHHGQASLRFVA